MRLWGQRHDLDDSSAPVNWQEQLQYADSQVPARLNSLWCSLCNNESAEMQAFRFAVPSSVTFLSPHSCDIGVMSDFL